MSLLSCVDRLEVVPDPIYDWITGTMEAIDFQVNSAFPHELTAIFQKVLDFANEHDTVYGIPDTGEKSVVKHTKIRKFIETVVSDALVATIKKYTKLNVEKITTSLPDNFDNMIDFYVLNQASDSADAIPRLLQASIGDGDKIGKNDTSILKVLNIRDSLDKKRAEIRKQLDLIVTINIPVGAFVTKDIITNNGDKCQLTAAEMTAVLMHEIGHNFANFEYMFDLSYVGYYGNNIFRNMRSEFERNPKKVITETIAIGEKSLTKIEDGPQKSLLKKSLDLLKHLDKSVMDDVEVHPEDHKNYHKGSHSYVGFIILSTIIVAIAIFAPLVAAPFLFIPLKELLTGAIKPGSSTSSEFSTDRNTNMYERLADEYVSRYKMSKHLNSALMKIRALWKEIARLGFNRIVHEKALRDSLELRILVKFISMPCRILVYIFTMKSKGIALGYEEFYSRLRRNVFNLVDIVKDQKLSKAVRDSIIKDIDDMEALLDVNKPGEFNIVFGKIVQHIFNLPEDLSNVFYQIFGSGKTEKEYFTLFEKLDEMLSNRGFYYAAKIHSIFDEK